MSPAETLTAIRDLVEQAEADGWDTMDGNRDILQRGRDAYAGLRTVMAGAFDGEGPADA